MVIHIMNNAKQQELSDLEKIIELVGPQLVGKELVFRYHDLKMDKAAQEIGQQVLDVINKV